jgi:recombination protein RecA
MSTFEEIQEKLSKASKGSRMMVLSDSEVSKINEWLYTPTHDLNRILSGSLYRGVAEKTHTLIVGPEASGKSSFMCLNLAAAQKLGYTPIIIDAEGAWTGDFVTRWGIDPTKAMVINTPWVEDIMVELAKIIEEGWTKLAIVIDSIGALESKKMVDDGIKGDVKADQGGLQKKIKRIMKMIVGIVKMQNSIAFSAGHYYGNPTGYGEPDQIGGGKYPKLAADYLITLKKSKLYANPLAKTAAQRGEVIGTEIKAATLKNRFYPPFQEAKFEINYKEGVNKLAGIVDIALDMGLIEKGGSWYNCDLLGMKIQGELKFYEELKNVDYKPLLDEIEKTLSTSGYSSPNEVLETMITEEVEESI